MVELAKSTRVLLRETWETYWVLVKIMAPVMVAAKVAADLGAVAAMARGFEPIMALVGLPGDMGIVWVAALLINIYAGAATLVALLPNSPLTGAEATVLGVMVLVAHAIPVEQRIARMAGPSFLFTTLLRIGGAIFLGVVLNQIYSVLGVLRDPVEIAWLPSGAPDADWPTWTLDGLRSLATIFLILLALLSLLKILEKTGVTAFLARALAPMLRLIGIGRGAVPLAMSGLLLGLNYGGALMIREARFGTVSRRDVFLSICFLCLCHGVIEDTLFVMALGADWTGVLLARVVFALVVVGVLAHVVHRMPDEPFGRYLCAEARP